MKNLNSTMPKSSNRDIQTAFAIFVICLLISFAEKNDVSIIDSLAAAF